MPNESNGQLPGSSTPLFQGAAKFTGEPEMRLMLLASASLDPAAGVWRQAMVHRQCRIVLARLADDLGRNAGDRAVGLHRGQNDAAGADFGPSPDLDVPQDLGPGADQHAGPHLGV